VSLPYDIYCKAIFLAAILNSLLPCSRDLFADTFGIGTNSFQIEFVTIGNPGNVADNRGWPLHAGSVGYTYRISKYEISTDSVEKANMATAGGANPLQISIDPREPNHPATNVTWIEAAKFVNWLNISSGYAPAYKFEDVTGIDPPPPNAVLDGFALWQPADPGYDPDNQYRNSLAHYFLPSVDEWYKAAYYDPSGNLYHPYPTGKFEPPIPVAGGTEPNTAVYDQHGPPGDVGPADIMNAGGLSSYGTMAQGGNVREWMETELDLVNDNIFRTRIIRGGAWRHGRNQLSSTDSVGLSPRHSGSVYGFRVASIPEPTVQSMLVLSLLSILGLVDRRRR
jgi:formylglycine-generating enzyme required for sulfatase activity